MRTDLKGTSNAVITHLGEFVAIVKCPKKGDITEKIQEAVKDHFSVESATLIPVSETVLKNYPSVTFNVKTIDEDNIENVHEDLEITVVPTY